MVIGLSCADNNPVSESDGDSEILLRVEFDDNKISSGNLQKVTTITTVTVTVTGPGMDTITENLTISGNTASGNISVPKGDDRRFVLTGRDQSNIIQFEGENSADIINNTETVNITVSYFPPNPVDFNISNVTTTTADVSWTASTAPDFDFYRLLLSTSNPPDPSNDGILDISDINTTSANITGMTPNTTYFYQIIVVDTELIFDDATPVKGFATALPFPPPVNFVISNITTTTADVDWEMSSAGLFSFYRLLVSTSNPPDTNNDGILDVFDITSTSANITGMTPNTNYFVSLIVVDTDNEFDTGTPVKNLHTAEETTVFYDDDGFETTLTAFFANSRMAVRFTPPEYPCYIKSILLYLTDNSGLDDNYRLVIMAPTLDDDVFFSETLTTTAGTVWKTLDPTWNNRDEGTISGGDFWAGIEYVNSGNPNWPRIGLDETSDAGRAEFRFMSWGPLPFFGNLGIRAIVEVGGGSSQTIVLMPTGIATPNLSSAGKEIKANLNRTVTVRSNRVLRESKPVKHNYDTPVVGTDGPRKGSLKSRRD